MKLLAEGSQPVTTLFSVGDRVSFEDGMSGVVKTEINEVAHGQGLTIQTILLDSPEEVSGKWRSVFKGSLVQ